MEEQFKLIMFLFTICMVFIMALIGCIIWISGKIDKLKEDIKSLEERVAENDLRFIQMVNAYRDRMERLYKRAMTNGKKIKRIILTTKEGKGQTTIEDIVKIKETPEILKATDIYGKKYHIIKEEVDFEIKDID